MSYVVVAMLTVGAWTQARNGVRTTGEQKSQVRLREAVTNPLWQKPSLRAFALNETLVICRWVAGREGLVEFLIDLVPLFRGMLHILCTRRARPSCGESVRLRFRSLVCDSSDQLAVSCAYSFVPIQRIAPPLVASGCNLSRLSQTSRNTGNREDSLHDHHAGKGTRLE